MNPDLTELFESWPFEPGRLNARIITGTDGNPRIQVRLDLGILQMHMDGRPDGQKPNGYQSLLEMFEARIDPETDEETAEDIEPEEVEPLVLTPEDCKALRDEAAQYYHRYMALLALEEFEAVVRDTTRNLRVLDLCRKYAQTESDRTELEPYRPYVLMIRARALASQALRDGEAKAALLALDEGLEALRLHFADRGEIDLFEQSSEVQMLRSMRSSLVPKLPVSQKTELRQRLQAAIQQENYELAAILRDELKLMGDEGSPPGSTRRPAI